MVAWGGVLDTHTILIDLRGGGEREWQGTYRYLNFSRPPLELGVHAYLNFISMYYVIIHSFH